MFRRSLPSILAGFNATLKQLDKLHARNNGQIARHKKKASEHDSAHQNLSAENTRISGVRSRISALVA